MKNKHLRPINITSDQKLFKISPRDFCGIAMVCSVVLLWYLGHFWYSNMSENCLELHTNDPSTDLPANCNCQTTGPALER